MSTSNFLKAYNTLYQKNDYRNNIDNKYTVIYLKLEDFSVIKDFYGTLTIQKIQKRVKTFLESKLKKTLYSFDLYLLNDGEFVVITNQKNLNKNINGFIASLKYFQKSVQDKLLIIDNIQYQISLLISVVYNSSDRLESAKLGIEKLLKTNKTFIISNDFSKMEKEKTKKNLYIIDTIRYAIQNSNVTTFFQPIIDNKTNQTVKYESLIRIIDKDKTVLTPANFLDIAKRGKYYYQLTKIVLQKSFQMAIQLNKEISINLSIRDIESTLIRKIIYDLLKKYKSVTNKITFELLEDEEIKDIETISYFITQVKKQGVKIALDDFGKGFSNFERLLHYKPDILKIDGLLIKDIDSNSYSRSIVKMIVNFAKEQGISTVAEFVENKSIYNCVKDLGVDFSQGYYFGKPAFIKNI